MIAETRRRDRISLWIAEHPWSVHEKERGEELIEATHWEQQSPPPTDPRYDERYLHPHF